VGTSNWQNISYNIDLVRKINPKSILDVGVGFGRWGILFREFLEIWESSKYDGKWERTIDGVEIYTGYIKDYHNYFYNTIHNENALDFLRRTNKHYDLINFGDVIEHFKKSEGEELINISLHKANYTLINIPIGTYWQQAGTTENPYEAHLSQWRKSDFTKFNNNIIKSFNDLALRKFLVVLLSKDKIRFDKRFGKHFQSKNILKHKLGLKKQVENFEKRKR